MSSYLKRLATVFAQEVGNNLSKYTFVFPNHRAGLFFRRYLGQALQTPIFSPKIMTINECFSSLSQLRIADQLTLLVRLYTQYRKLRPTGEPIEQFLHWGKMMLADFSEIDNHLVENVEALYAAIKDMRDIDLHYQSLSDTQRNAIKKFWGDFYASNDKNKNELHKRFIRTWDLLYPLYKGLTDSLLQDNLAYEGLLHRHVLNNWDNIPKQSFENHYVFIGFNALTNSERQLMIRLRDQDIADFYFDYENAYLSDPENRASFFKHDNLSTFSSRYKVPPATQDSHPTITHISVDSTIGEAREVYQILHQIYPQGTPATTDFTRTAVVLPDEQLLIPLLDCFPDSIQQINVTMGYPLRASDLYMPIAYPDEKLTSAATGEEAIDLLREQWKTMLTPANNEAHYILSKSLEQIANCISKNPHIFFSAESVLQIMRMLTMQSTIPYIGEPLNGLQVMGVLETRALDFDNLIITGFNDDLYPGRAHNNSFIPYILRRGFSLPTPERQDAIFAYNFYRMLSHAQHVWFITNAVADDQHSGEVSRYFYQLKWQYGLHIDHINVIHALCTPSAKEQHIHKTPAILELLNKAHKRGFSASAMNSYLFCQKKFFYRYVKGIHEPQQEDDIVTSDATIGTVLHKVMQILYTPYINKNVTTSDIQEIIDSLTDQRWEELPIDDVRNDHFSLYIVKNYVRNILAYDLTQTPFIYISTEQEVHGKLDIPQIGSIPFYGFVDRMDKHADTIRIVDYKTGKATIEFRDMDHVFDRTENQDKALQTLLYCWLVKHQFPSLLQDGSQLTPHIYPSRGMSRAEEVKTLIHQKGHQEFVFDDSIEQDFINRLSKLLQEIHNADLPFIPTDKKQRCQSCPYFALCKG